MKAIFERKSERNFVRKEISSETMNYLLKCAMNAPNAGHQEPWEFIVFRDDEAKKKLGELHGYGDMLDKVDAAVMFCINKSKLQWDGYWQLDTGAAVENFMIAATDRGYATLWLEIFPVDEKVEKARRILGLSEDIVPMVLVPVGGARLSETREARFREDLIHYDKW